MVGASDEVQLIALMPAQKRATIVTTAGAGSVTSSRAERVRLCDQDFPYERDQIAARSGPDSAPDLRHNLPPLWTGRRSSVPTPTLTASPATSPTRAGHFHRAHRRSRHGFLLSSLHRCLCSGRQSNAAHPACVARSRCNVRPDNRLSPCCREFRYSLVDAGHSARMRSGGQPRFPRSSPRSSSGVDIRRRQPGGRDAGTVARARRTQPVQVRGRWRRTR